MKTVSFSQIVSGAQPLTDAFDSYGAARLWWCAILWLHGKPTAPSLSDEERQKIVADGFRFYAQLYRFLGALFWLVAAASWTVGVYDTQNQTLYWTGAGTLTGAFLWFASGLGFAGAKALRENKASARLVLCAFMVAIIAFLSALIAVLSVIAQTQTGHGAVLNLCLVSLVWAFGLGSYLIEVLYLVAEARLNTSA